MSHATHNAGQNATITKRPMGKGFLVVLVLGLAVLAYVPSLSGLMDVVVKQISDAYIQVSTFVAATLFLFYGLERWLRLDLTRILSRSGHWQVPIAAVLGALPGCGGAIMVMTRYVSGHLSFGAVLATLTATMGDAAFLLLAKEPVTGLLVMAAGMIIGTLSGYIADFIHGRNFLRGEAQNAKVRSVSNPHHAFARPFVERIWVLLFIPGIIIGVFTAFQVNLDIVFATKYFDLPITYFGFIGGMLCLLMWLIPRLMPMAQHDVDSVLRRTITDTNFVTSWVILAFLIFGVGIYLFNFNLHDLFSGVAVFTPLIAVALGFLPGCGPQVIVTSLYLEEIIPLSAQLGNAISNDGDALFPAIALAPRTAILATIYSAIPALILAYSWYYLFEV